MAFLSYAILYYHCRLLNVKAHMCNIVKSRVNNSKSSRTNTQETRETPVLNLITLSESIKLLRLPILGIMIHHYVQYPPVS
jgi:hypothetical protein